MDYQNMTLSTRAISILKDIQSWDDVEAAHGEADEVLCWLLSALGFDDVIEEYEKIEKYYA